MEKVIIWTVGFVLITYLVVGIMGYATFSSNISILNDTDISNGIILISYGYTLGGVSQQYSSMVVIVSDSYRLV